MVAADAYVLDSRTTIRWRIRRGAVGDARVGTAMTRPTIAVALAQFLDEQECRLSPKTAAQYRDVVELLQHHLNGYAYLSLDERDAKRFERLQHATGDAQREFCQIFGPEHILPNVGEFLGYFMVRKVIASRVLLRAARTVTKRLAAWLAEQGYVEAEAAEMATERGAKAARELPKADELAARLPTRPSSLRITSRSRGLSPIGSGSSACSMVGSVDRFSSPRILAVGVRLAGLSPV